MPRRRVTSVDNADEDTVNQGAADHGLPGDQVKALRRRLHGLSVECDWGTGATKIRVELIEELANEYGANAVHGGTELYSETATPYWYGSSDHFEGGILRNPQDFGMVVCYNPKCRAYLDPGLGKFCPSCGDAHEANARRAAVIADLVDCGECGETVTPGGFCEQCGAELPGKGLFGRLAAAAEHASDDADE